MKHKLFLLGALFLLLTVTSCRQESDTLYSYGQNDELRFQEANESYAGEFKLFWHAMNQNYPLWDYEREFGFDWDAAYDAFLPRFEALDQRRENGEEITDEEYQSLMARKYLDKKLPGENMVVLPENTVEAKTKHQNTVVENAPKEYSNFEKWMMYLFPSY